MPTQSYNTGNVIYDNNYGNQNVVADYKYISDLLANIPDNSSNLIDAKDVRDAVWSLWNRIEDINTGLSSSGINIYGSASGTFSANLRYDRTRLSSAAAVGGVPTGSTFSGTIQDVLDRIFYPYTKPTCALTGGGDRQFGSPPPVTLSFTLNKFEKPVTAASLTLLPSLGILSITIPTVLTANNTIPATFGPSTLSTTPPSVVTIATHSAFPVTTSESNTYTLTIGDGVGSSQATTTVTWKNYLYYGTLDLSGLPGNSNPDLTVRPDGSNSATVASSILQIEPSITSNTIKATSGTNRPIATKVFATSRTLSLSNYEAGNNYLFFAWPSIFGTPTFTINGLEVSTFTKVKSSFAFSNEHGFSGVNYDVWISNTVYGKSTIIIS
jgi:hypothetical protein